MYGHDHETMGVKQQAVSSNIISKHETLQKGTSISTSEMHETQNCGLTNLAMYCANILRVPVGNGNAFSRMSIAELGTDSLACFKVSVFSLMGCLYNESS